MASSVVSSLEGSSSTSEQSSDVKERRRSFQTLSATSISGARYNDFIMAWGKVRDRFGPVQGVPGSIGNPSSTSANLENFLVHNPHDAAMNGDQKGSDIGFFIRSSTGSPVLAVSEPLSFLSPTVGEALALRMGVLEALKAGLSTLHMESDNLEVINQINGVSREGDVYLLSIVQDIVLLEIRGFVSPFAIFQGLQIWLLTPWLARMAISCPRKIGLFSFHGSLSFVNWTTV
ncbi:hypothetical protein NE237_021853 [Protea cynaroides]|uniref:RNase H type-1 domain-containing protein n=1 Tax=Protea cynaroides TaxID=273540 RepID=A0A9Q0HC01_9MAGN|nr:hypothetical protein NE237_021853 [Protea cynaroides]